MFALVIALAPAVEKQPPPNPPDALGPLFGGLAIAVLVVSIVWIGVRRIRGRGTESARKSAGGAAIGNALFELGSILQPDRPNVETIVRIEEEGIEDEAGDGRDPERLRARPRPPPDRALQTAVESGPTSGSAVKQDGEAADAADRRDHAQSPDDRTADAIPPSVPRE